MAAPTAAPNPPPAEVLPAGDCPRCGEACAARQEYCLGCGQRLAVSPSVGDALATTWGRRSVWYTGDWVWPAFAALVVAMLAAVAVIVVRAGGDASDGAFLTATEAPVAAPVPTADSGTFSETAPEASLRATLPELNETVPAPRRPKASPARRRGRVTKWPAGTNGFTVVLSSVPGGPRAPATKKAKDASNAGLPDVGVLSSSEYSSLHPGYLVVFSGIYENRTEAEAAIANARAKGYNDAYVAPVAR